MLVREVILLHLRLYCFSDLMTEDGVTFEMGEQFDNEDEEDFAYSPHVQFSNEEMLNMLNMNDFDDEDNEDNEKETVSLYGMTFSKLKTKMTNLTPNQKVNQILYYFLYIIIFLKMI